MRKACARVVLVLLGLAVLALWLPALLFSFIVAVIENKVAGLWTDAADQMGAIARAWLAAWRSPVDTGADSGA